jgi:hypothetical protein
VGSSPPARDRPEGVPENFWDPDRREIKAADWAKSYEELRTFKASDDARRAALPGQADLYKPDLPESVKIPADLELKLDTPMYREARELAYAKGWTQGDFTEALGLFVKHQIADQQRLQAYYKGELEALGDNREARLTALDKFREATVKAWFPEAERAEALEMIMRAPPNRYFLRWMEKASEALSKQGVKSYSAVGREPIEGRADGRPENWDKMDAVSRRAWNLQNPDAGSPGQARGGRAA